MKLSHLLFALVLIAYGAAQLGSGFPIRIVWWGLIIASLVWILEGLLGGITVPRISRSATPAE